MRRAVAAGLLALGMLVPGCKESPPPEPTHETQVETRAQQSKGSAQTRAARRYYDGAPPTIPHDPYPGTCVECHGDRGVEVENVGFSPPSPHSAEDMAGGLARCRQCHVPRTTEELFVASTFEGLAQDLRSGPTFHPWAPPRIPHELLMRENCSACHDGPAAREAIRTPHPERERCTQCHVQVKTTETFKR